MIDAKALATLPTGLLELFGIWIPRKGDNVRFTVEVVQNYFTTLNVELYQKNYDETGNGAATSVSVDFDNTTGRAVMELLGSKELLRVKLTMAAAEGITDSEVGTVLLRFLQPVWFEAVKV